MRIVTRIIGLAALAVACAPTVASADETAVAYVDHPRIVPIAAAIVEQRARVAAVREDYARLAREVAVAGEALERLRASIRSGEHPARVEGVELARAVHEFELEQRAAISKAEAGYRRRHADYAEWIAAQREAISAAHAAIDAAARDFDAAKQVHDDLHGTITRRIETYNAKVGEIEKIEAADPRYAPLADELRALDVDIETGRTRLDAAREQAVRLGAAHASARDDRDALVSTVREEKARRERELAEARAMNETAARDADDRIATRRAEVERRTKALDEALAGEIRAAGDRVRDAQRVLDDGFGSEPQAFLAAVRRWLADEGDAEFFESDGETPRFDRAHSQVDRVYAALTSSRDLHERLETAIEAIRAGQSQ